MGKDDATPKKYKRVNQGEGDGTASMKLRELNEAYKDKTHPRHEEAVKELEKLAKTLTPRMAEYQKVFSNNAALASITKQPWLETNKILGKHYESMQKMAAQSIAPAMKASTSSLFGNTIKIPSIIDKPPAPPISPMVNHLQELDESLTQGIQERAEREKQQHELAKKQYDALEALVAQQTQNTREMAALREQQAQSDEKNSRATKWNLILVTLTLLVSIASFVASLIGLTKDDASSPLAPTPAPSSYSSISPASQNLKNLGPES